MDIITNYQNHLKAKCLARSTQATYLSEFRKFAEFFKGEDYRYVSKEKIVGYLAHLYDLGCSPSKVNQAINAIKFYKERVLGQKRQTYFLKRPRRGKFMPCILSQEQMFAVVNSPDNLKHRTLLFVMYDNGLRKSELINLRLSDVRTLVEHPHIIVRDSKHHGSRTIYLSDECLERIRAYYRAFKPEVYLFEGAVAGAAISETTITNILKNALRSQRVRQRFRVHDLRHNFATHCLLNGTDIYHLSKVLGHRSVETTQKYYAHLLPDQVVIRRPQPQKTCKVIPIRKAG